MIPFTTHCLLCKEKLNIDNAVFIECSNEKCKVNKVCYRFTYLSNKHKMSWHFYAKYNNIQYFVGYYNAPLNISILQTLTESIAIQIPISSLTELILIPDNFDKKFPTILTFQ